MRRSQCKLTARLQWHLSYLTPHPRPWSHSRKHKGCGDLSCECLLESLEVSSAWTSLPIKNAKNPYTGKLLADTVKKDEVHVYIARNWQVEANQGNTFGNNLYFKVHDNIFDVNNWSTTRINPGD